MKLHELNVDDIAVITEICCQTDSVKRLNELGMHNGKTVQVIQKTPFKGPIVIEIDNSTIALRYEEATCIHLK